MMVGLSIEFYRMQRLLLFEEMAGVFGEEGLYLFYLMMLCEIYPRIPLVEMNAAIYRPLDISTC